MRLLTLFPLFVAAASAAQTPALPEPLVNPDHTVTFRYTAPAATKFVLALENHPRPIPLEKNEAGVWTVTTPTLPAEFYSYHFTVDGLTQLDPLNKDVIFGELNASSSFLVPGPDLTGDDAIPSGARPWERTAVPHGVVHHHTYTSSIVLGLKENQNDFYVYTPPGYDPRTATKYPVLYLLHGWSDTAAGWTLMGHANDILDNLIAQGKARPMIVVMPLGYGDMSFVHSGSGVWTTPETVDHNTTLFTQSLLTEVIPQVARLYNVSGRREDRAIAGLSMGGLEALTVGLLHSDQFAWVGGFSAAVHLVTPQTFASVDPKKANLKLLSISCGVDDGLLEADRKLSAALQAQGFKVQTSERAGLGHVWQQWRPDLATFASQIFK